MDFLAGGFRVELREIGGWGVIAYRRIGNHFPKAIRVVDDAIAHNLFKVAFTTNQAVLYFVSIRLSLGLPSVSPSQDFLTL